MASSGYSSPAAASTPRTPHSPGSGPIGSSSAGGMSAPPRSAGPADAAAVRPVTARTWQAMGAAPAPGDEAPRRVSVCTNDLYNNSASGLAASANARPASPLYQPASARPGTPSATPTPRSAERLQHQRIATPSRLQGESAGSPRGGQRVQNVPGLGLSTANVPAAAEVQQQHHHHHQAAPLDSIALLQESQQQQQQQQQQQKVAEAMRPGTAPSSQLRTSTISLAALKQPAPVHAAAAHSAQQQLQQAGGEAATVSPRLSAAGGSPRLSAAGGSSSIALDSPRVRQLVLRNFAGAVPAGGGSGTGATSPLGSTPRPALHGERPWAASSAVAGGSSANRHPPTPSFQPVALAARPATALGGPTNSDAQFGSIKAAYGSRAEPKAAGVPGASGELHMPLRPREAYPQPPQTAPSKAAAGPQDAPAAPMPGSLASFGISPAAFVASRGNWPADREEAENKAAAVALTQAAMVANTNFATKADLRRFLLTPGPADKPLCCKILRSGGGMLKGGPQYTLLVEQEGGKAGAFLLAARKRKGGPGGSTYVLSIDQHEVSRHSPSYVGKLRSNFIGTEFVMYDSGSSKESSGMPRCELGAAQYQTNVLGTKGPRKMTVLIPKLEPGGTKPMARSPRSEGETLLGQYKSYNLSSCVVLRNKPPRWNQAMSAYCLNFGGRVTQASVKNFQLVSVDNMERTILQFGKVASDAFTMDYSYPMTALQAFAICVSSMTSKLACE